MSQTDEEEEFEAGDEPEKRETAEKGAPKRRRFEGEVLSVRLGSELSSKIQKAVDASEGKYRTASDFARDSIERRIRALEERPHGEEDELDWTETDEAPTKDDKKYEADVTRALKIIRDVKEDVIAGTFEEEDFEDIIEAAKDKKLIKRPAVWSDERVQKMIRELLRDDVYPASLWDKKRKFRKAKAREWTRAFKEGLRLPESVARALVIDPAFSDVEPYEE